MKDREHMFHTFGLLLSEAEASAVEILFIGKAWIDFFVFLRIMALPLIRWVSLDAER